ncbi:HNH endonuclease [Dokdonia sp. Hel_I_63]|uniref:HNH endonuclease n=1 Tax=Dokdonia sp. Hel_I_63 TaxID=1249996 RepID=UPI00119A9D6D|nr:HNH endonuclease [Dokdonia sp. Hel_I_63]TVZ21151.1 HNH endonuclease [Dokdonia sp. Hel_I_63]
MTCTKGRAYPTAHTKLMLFADSAGYCQNPSCNTNLFLTVGESEFHIAEMAHIISDSDTGPRANRQIPKEVRSSFDNLILLCPTCHTKVDKAESEFPKTIILEWKINHSNRVKSLFNIKRYKTRQDARKNITPLLIQNKIIFETYGPLTDSRFNPESETPKVWLSKIQQNILPNNRMLINIIDENYSLLLEREITFVELFRQHVLDFESRHINKIEINATRFPTEFSNIYKD